MGIRPDCLRAAPEVSASVLDRLCATPVQQNTTSSVVAPASQLEVAATDSLGQDAVAPGSLDDVMPSLDRPARPARACAHCGAVSGTDGVRLKKCDRCRKARYCGRQCQKAAWKSGHKEECQPQPEDVD